CSVEDFSNAERIAALQSLLDRPLDRMKAWNLFSFEVLQEALGSRSQQLEAFWPAMPRSIGRILGKWTARKTLMPPSKKGSRKDLKDVTTPGNQGTNAPESTLNTRLDSLRKRLAIATRRRGTKADLAAFLDVPRPRV